jgi:phosphinothricin acetyltransferase
MADVRIRPLQERDLEAVVAIYNDVVANTTATFEESLRPVSEFAQAFHEKQKTGIPWIVVEKGGEIVGYGTYGAFRRVSGYRTTVEHSLHVRSDCRGQGIGSLILKELIQAAKAQGLHAMVAAVDSSNAASRVLHEKFGFVKVGEMPEIARKFDRWLGLTLLQLIL